MLPGYVIGLDLGQAHDHTAIAVAECRELPTGRREHVMNLAAGFDGFEHLPPTLDLPQMARVYDILHLERLPLGTSYVEIPDRLSRIETRVRRRWVELAWEEDPTSPAYLDEAPVALVVDQTGVGRPVVDLLREHGLAPVAITITAGDQVLRLSRGEYRVPKRNLAGCLQTLLQTRRLRWAASLAEASTLKRELEHFKAKISLTGHDSYEAGGDWREGNHDDLVLAVALMAWYGEYGS